MGYTAKTAGETEERGAAASLRCPSICKPLILLHSRVKDSQLYKGKQEPVHAELYRRCVWFPGRQTR